MLVNRRSILRQFESCAAGLSNTGNLEQADCFVLAGGKISTFNDEVRCAQDTELPFNCAVPSKPLLETLRKLTEDEIDMSYVPGKLSIKCLGVRKIDLNVQAEVISYVGSVEDPSDWQDVVPAFADALAMVSDIASADSEESIACVHFRPKGLEATDGFQAVRYRVDCPVSRPSLVKRSACVSVNGMGIAAMAETDNWIHWKTYTGLQVSVRRYVDPYPDLGAYFGTQEATSIQLPSTLMDSLQKAAMFLPDSSCGKLATFRFKKGKMMIHGQNESGSYEERRDVAYDGPEICFGLSPKYMANILKYDYPCMLTDSTLRVKGDSFMYVTAKEMVGQ